MTYLDHRIEQGSLLFDMDEVLPVIDKHHSIYQHAENLPKFDLDVDNIVWLEQHDLSFSTKLVVNDKLEGFISSVINDHLHHKGVRFASVGVIYINPTLGNKRISLLKDMITHHEGLAKKYKVEYLEIGASPKKDITPLLEKLGYFKTDIVSMKRL